ncbi:MAG: CvpA family protein [Rikenella sp.]|nr:CvpA family protein [Rikenella sp.]
MNIIDILVCLTLLLCVWSGWRSGILVQLSGIVGIVVGAWVAYRFSHAIGRRLDLEELPSEVLFVIVLVGVLICVILLCRLVTRLMQAGGLAGPLRVLGGAFAVAKGALLLGLALVAVEAAVPWLSETNRASFSRTLKEARSYALLKGVGDYVFPYIVSGVKTAVDLYPTTDPTGDSASSSATGATIDKAPEGDSAMRIIP